jgi:hypothetical protein
MNKAIGTAALLLLGVLAPASAQTPDSPPATAAAPSQERPQRIWVNFNFGATSGSKEYTLSTTFTEYAEEGSFATTQQVNKGFTFDFSGMVRVWRGLLVGAGYSGLNTETTSDYTLTVPHPLYYNQPRTVTGNVETPNYREASLNLFVGYTFPLSDRLDVTAFAGPTFFTMEQAFATGVRYTESAPAYTITVDEVKTTNVKESAPGVMVGGDVTYMFSRFVGAGFFARYNAATLRVTPTGGGAPTDIDLGGLQWGGGIRFRFW